MTTQPRRKRGLFTGLVAVATALTLAFSATPAQADGPVIDPAARGSITIHAFQQPLAIGVEGDAQGGTDTTGLVPVADGMIFTAQSVSGVALTTNAGWEAAAALTPEAASTMLNPETYRSTPTAAGLASIANLPVGLYYVKVTTFPTNVTPVAPFLVTIPMTNPTDLDEWIYDVHVYPKSSTTFYRKTVSDEAATTIGDDVVWTINADIPKVQNIDKYEIVDVLDPKLQYVSDVVSLTGTSGQTLTDADYLVTTAPANTVTVTFTPAGRTKLASAWLTDPDAEVQVVLTTEVLEAGEIGNVATVYPNSRSFGMATDVVTTKFGSIVLEKANAKNPATKLQGAEFRVYLTRAAAVAKTEADAIAINGVKTFTSTGVDGRVVIEGLRYSGFVNNAPVTTPETGYRTYWVSEVKAPTGYELLAEPIEVVVDSVSTTVVTRQVLNVPKNAGFQLPLTGASGASTIIMAAGILLLVVGTAAVVVSRRRRQQV